MLYENRPTTLNDFLSNKYNNVHDELYNSALNKYIYKLIEKYINSNLLYEFFQLLSKINANDEQDIEFDEIYKRIFINNENTPHINLLLEELSIDRVVFFNVMYNITVDKLNNVKHKLVNFYQDDNYDFQSIIEGISEISDIKDFRLTCFNEAISGETSSCEMYSAYVDNNEVIFNENIVHAEDDYFDLVFTEDEQYIIILDVDDYVHIAYDNNGKWILIVNSVHPLKNIDNAKDIITKYMNYESYGVIDLYKENICKLYKRFHKIIEIKNLEYWMPSSVRIINKIAPYRKYNVDLKKYWNNNQSNSEYNLSEIKITKDDNMLDSEVTEINYVTGKAKMQSRSNDITYEVPFKYLDENVDVSEDMVLKKSFTTKYH